MSRNAQIFAGLAAAAIIVAAAIWIFALGGGEEEPDRATVETQTEQAETAGESQAEPAESDAEETAEGSEPAQEPAEAASAGEGQVEESAETSAAPSESGEAAGAPEAGDEQQAALPESSESATSAETQEPKLQAPTFDVVRVEPNGDAVIAGRAMPGATVTILDNNRPLGEVRADQRGEWVFLPDERLAPGSHELSLEAEKDGVVLLSENVAVIFVPAPQIASAPEGGEAEEPGGAGAETGETGETGAAADAGGAVAEAGETGEAAGADGDAEAGAEQQAAAPSLSGEGGEPSAPEPGVQSSVQEPLAVLTSRDGEGGGTQILQGPGTEAEPGALALQVVDYDAEGHISVSGQGAPGHTIILYLDNAPVGQTEVGDDGRWTIAVEDPVGYGLFTLRVDELGPEGDVIARVETPFSRIQIEIADLPQDQFVMVEPGNSLWVIARRLLGSGINYSVIFDANRDQIRDPDLIYPGQIFVVPQSQGDSG